MTSAVELEVALLLPLTVGTQTDFLSHHHALADANTIFYGQIARRNAAL